MKFKDFDEVQEYIDMNKRFMVEDVPICEYCEEPMTNFYGSLEYFNVDLPDDTNADFCCESCIIAYLEEHYMEKE